MDEDVKVFYTAVSEFERLYVPHNHTAYKKITETVHHYANLTTTDVEDLSVYEAMSYLEYCRMRTEESMKKSMNQSRANRLFLRLFKCMILRIKYEETAEIFATIYRLCKLPPQTEEYYRIYAELWAKQIGATLVHSSSNSSSEDKITHYISQAQYIEHTYSSTLLKL
jgi:hypothetical protein